MEVCSGRKAPLAQRVNVLQSSTYTATCAHDLLITSRETIKLTITVIIVQLAVPQPGDSVRFIRCSNRFTQDTVLALIVEQH